MVYAKKNNQYIFFENIAMEKMLRLKNMKIHSFSFVKSALVTLSLLCAILMGGSAKGQITPTTNGDTTWYCIKNNSNSNYLNPTGTSGTNLTEPIMAKGKDGSELQAWNMSSYDFIEGDSPKSVNPVLWRMEKLNNYNGLFQVYPKITCEDGKTNTELYGGKDGKIYQVRSYDLATMTLVKSVTGWIIIDPLGGEETALAAWECFKKNID